MKTLVLTVGKSGTPWADKAVAHYGKRLKRWTRLEEDQVKAERFRGDVDAVKQAEGERLLGRVGPRDLLITLDERGEAPDTDAFIALVEEARMDPGATRMVFALGGAYGHDPAVRAASWRVVRLSSLVLNHEVARVVLFEQLYRAWASIHGVPYHH